MFQIPVRISYSSFLFVKGGTSYEAYRQDVLIRWFHRIFLVPTMWCQLVCSHGTKISSTICFSVNNNWWNKALVNQLANVHDVTNLANCSFCHEKQACPWSVDFIYDSGNFLQSCCFWKATFYPLTINWSIIYERTPKDGFFFYVHQLIHRTAICSLDDVFSSTSLYSDSM